MNPACPLVLVMGDDPTGRQKLDVCMRALGCHVVMAVMGREALAAIERAVVRCAGETIPPADVALPSVHVPAPLHEPVPVAEAAGFHEQVNAYRRQVLVTALRRTNGNHTQAAKLLGLHRTYFLRLLQKLDIHEDGNEAPGMPPQNAGASASALSFPLPTRNPNEQDATCPSTAGLHR